MKGTQIRMAAIVILALTNIITLYILFQSKSRSEAIIASNQEEISAAYNEIDSISLELDERIRVIDSLGGDIDTLLQIKEQLEADKRYIIRNSNRKINELEDRVEGYRQLLVQQDNEIERLKQMNEALFAENTTLKQQTNQLSRNITALEKKERELESKLEIAGQLRTDNIVIAAINERGRERTASFRDRQIDQIRVSFDVLENEVSPIGSRTIYLVIRDANDNPVFDTERGSGTFIFDQKETFFTAKKEILYDRTLQHVEMSYAKGTPYSPGIYTAGLFADGQLIGMETFEVK